MNVKNRLIYSYLGIRAGPEGHPGGQIRYFLVIYLQDSSKIFRRAYSWGLAPLPHGHPPVAIVSQTVEWDLWWSDLSRKFIQLIRRGGVPFCCGRTPRSRGYGGAPAPSIMSDRTFPEKFRSCTKDSGKFSAHAGTPTLSKVIGISISLSLFIRLPFRVDR